MSLDKMRQLVTSLAKSLENGEKIATPVLAAKLAKCSEVYPHDQTIGAMSRIIEKMASNNTMFISKADLKALYSKLYSRNTKFAELFENELGGNIEYAPTSTTFNRDEATELNTYQVGDQVLANALNSVFDKNAPLKMYSQELANKALKSVASALDVWNLKPSKLIVKADYETPKGVTSFYVPVELRDNKIVEASVFMGNSGPRDLNHVEIKKYLGSVAGNKLKISGALILDVITKAASENREISDAELALTRLNASREGKSEFFQNQIVGQKIAEASVKEVELPKSDEFESFEKTFSSPQGLASFNFGADKVKTARQVIARDLIGFGYSNPQISVTGSENNTVYYAVSLDAGKIAFTVPVKIEAGKINKPSVLLCNGSVSSFSKETINSLYVNNQTDYKVAAVASPQFGLKPSDLINNIRTALAEGNYAKAEDALNVLSQCDDSKAYATGFNVYLNGLKTANATASEPECKCSLIVKSSVSQHPICGHTGLPIHKVYQDKHGNCQPLYRRGMDESYEAASFMNSKIFG
jgi:hypothetical protein